MQIEWRRERDREVVVGLAKRNAVTARRMERIAAAANFTDLQHPANGRAHFLEVEYTGYFAIDLESKTRPARLICEPIGNFQTKGGQYVRESITEFRVVKIEKNYHTK